MTPDFVTGFFTAMLVQGFVLAVTWTLRRLAETRGRRCPTCDSPNIDESGCTIFPVEKLWVCPACGDTMTRDPPEGALRVHEYLNLRGSAYRTSRQLQDCVRDLCEKPQGPDVTMEKMP